MIYILLYKHSFYTASLKDIINLNTMECSAVNGYAIVQSMNSGK